MHAGNATIMLDFSNINDMLRLFWTYLRWNGFGMVFYYFQSWKIKNPKQHQIAKVTFNIDFLVTLIKYEFFDNKLDNRNEQEQIRAIRKLEQ